MDMNIDQLLSQARSLFEQFRQGGETRCIDEVIILDRQVLSICRGSRDALRAQSLTRLAFHLGARYNHLGSLENLDEAIVLGRGALDIFPPEHQGRAQTLNNLASHLWSRYGRLGSAHDLDEAIFLERDVLALCEPGHPYRPLVLENLAAHLWARYNCLGGMEDLEGAISLSRESLAVCPQWRLDSSNVFANLASYHYYRYNRLQRPEDLKEAIALGRKALQLRPVGHLERSASLSNLALHLSALYERYGEVEYLNEAVTFGRQALMLRPPGHPGRSLSLDNLAVHLYLRYEQLGVMEDLNEAISLGRDALLFCTQGHPDWSSSLKNLAAHLSARYRKIHNAEDREEQFALYAKLELLSQTVTSSDLSAAKAWVDAAEELQHPTTHLAYKETLRLLVHHLSFLPSLPQHLPILKTLTSSLATDAFSACLRNQSPTTAVELLEQGRGVFWGQLNRLRSPLVDVISSGPDGKVLADEFTRLTSLVYNALNSPGVDQHDRVCHLNLELQKVVSSIRGLPGLSSFLLPSLFTELRCAASGGPVIIVNASRYSCDALVVSVDKDPIHVPLSITKKDVQELVSSLHSSITLAMRFKVTKELYKFLRKLWEDVVSPIVDRLPARGMGHPRSRIWWCPTAEFTLLPLHAAAPYRKGQQGLADLYISSYTPTLSALIRARRYDSPASGSGRKRFIAIGQANASGTKQLACVGPELDAVGQSLNGLTTFTRIEGQESSVGRVTEELCKNEWAHLACHGLPNRKKPFESAFALHDGRLTIQRIIQCDLRNNEFAFLSACHTTVGDDEIPDEAIHLAAAMQFSGFRSVIGTMWAVDDDETSKITSVFYKHVVDDSGCPDHSRAAYALWKTMRSVNIPLDQRLLYIHIGAQSLLPSFRVSFLVLLTLPPSNLLSIDPRI